MVSGTVPDDNFRAVTEMLAEAAASGAQLAVLPENFAFMGRSERERLPYAETVVSQPTQEQPMQALLQQQARHNGLWLIGGTVPVTSAEHDRVYSAMLVYAPDGRLVARYDKIHLFDVDVPAGGPSYRESQSTVAGDSAVVCAGAGTQIGLSICYDLRFPELFRTMTMAGTEVFALGSAFTATTGAAHWEPLVRTRAIENQAAVIAACQGGEHDGGRETFGRTMIVDGWGTILAMREQGEGVIVADIDLAAQRQLRKTFPVLEHRRAIEVKKTHD
ncbi:MAG: carbon-nitrogen hydrolase family protein [Gammaproteobacteria bacterium]|nr:carbon-nitrogen hydrolase family protein [Gammaproteobacteria bacterium]